MIHWTEYQTEERGALGRFICPQCGADAAYEVRRIFSHCRFYVIVLPIAHSKAIFDESVRCTSCGARLPITALAADAPVVNVSADEGAERGEIATSLGNVVVLSRSAAQEILRRFFSSKFKGKPVVRITPPLSADEGYLVGFDVALADGRDWIGESQGIGIVIDRRDTALLLGRTIDFHNGIFCEGGRSGQLLASRM